VEQQLKEQIKEVGEAVNQSLSDSKQITEVVSRIKKGGHAIFLVLEAKIGVRNQFATSSKPFLVALPTIPESEEPQLKELGKELEQAFNETFSASKPGTDVVSRIRESGYDVFLTLQAAIGPDEAATNALKRKYFKDPVSAKQPDIPRLRQTAHARQTAPVLQTAPTQTAPVLQRAPVPQSAEVQRKEEVREVTVSPKEKPEARTRVPWIGDLVFVQDRPGELFQVASVCGVTKIVGLAHVGRKETEREWTTAYFSALTFPHPKWWYELREYGLLGGSICLIVVAVALLWVLIRVGAGPYLLVGFALFVAWVWTKRFARQKRIRKARAR